MNLTLDKLVYVILHFTYAQNIVAQGIFPVLWSWNDFPIYKYDGISFAAHLARSLDLLFSILAQEIAILLFFTEKAQLQPQTYGIYL